MMPNYVISQSPGRVIVRNYEGVFSTYTEPTHYENKCNCEWCKQNKIDDGVISMLHGNHLSIEPTHLVRRKRMKK